MLLYSHIMSRLSRFVGGAGTVAQIQDHILDAMENLFNEEEYTAIEAAVLAPGYEGWESRALGIIKATTKERWEDLHAQVEKLQHRYRAGVPHRTQDEWIPSDPQSPHLRVYWCLKCGFRITSLALGGLCCFGMPECSRCHFSLHEKTCKRGKSDANRRVPKTDA